MKFFTFSFCIVTYFSAEPPHILEVPTAEDDQVIEEPQVQKEEVVQIVEEPPSPPTPPPPPQEEKEPPSLPSPPVVGQFIGLLSHVTIAEHSLFLQFNIHII